MASLNSGVTGALTQHRDAIEAALQSALVTEPGAEPEIVGAARYVMGWQDATGQSTPGGGGKRIRPALTVVAAEIFGGFVADALPGAVAVELVHNFSLVHDEIQDQDDVRHGRPTAYTVWGAGQAINLGDFLYGRALRALSGGSGPGDRRLAALDVLLRAIEGMIGGQWRDIAFESRDGVGVPEYLQMVEGKTGVLLGAALEMGAILGGATRADAAVMGQWGVKLGLAFQAVDDYLGIWGDAALTGKTTTGDIARKKKTLPILHGLADPKAGPVIRAAYAADRQLDELPAIVAALQTAGGDVLCRDTARRFAAEAESLLPQLHLSEDARIALREVAGYFCDRDF